MASLEFGYSSFERLDQGSKRRAEMLEFYRETKVAHTETFSSQEILGSKIKSEKSRLALALAPLALAILGAASFSCGGGPFDAKKARAEVLRNLNDELHPSNTLTEAVGEVAGIQIKSPDVTSEGPIFDKLPVPRDPDIKVVQGWIYKGYHDGQFHGAIDYYYGTNPDIADDWQPFPVLVPADGKACKYDFATSFAGEQAINHAVKVIHDNGYETVYLHLEDKSRMARGIVLPLCNLPKEQWLRVVSGQKIGEASDSGTNPGVFHLHLMVYNRAHVLVDPYDIYGKRELYPNSDITNGKFCGPNALFSVEICPRNAADVRVGAATLERPSATATLQATPTPEIPTVQANEDLAHIDLNTVFDSHERGKIIAAKSLEAQDMAYTFIELLLAGDNASLQQAYAMEIPENLESSRFSNYELGNFDAPYTPFNQIQICSRQMHLGEFQRYGLSQFRTSAQATLSQTAILNIQRGFAPRDRYWVGVDFTFRRYDTSLRRLGFGDFRALYDDTYLIFEDVEGRLYIARNLLCFNGPVIYKVAQDPWHD